MEIILAYDIEFSTSRWTTQLNIQPRPALPLAKRKSFLAHSPSPEHEQHDSTPPHAVTTTPSHNMKGQQISQNLPLPRT